MQKEIDFNALGNALNTTWGKSSTGSISTSSIKSKLHGNHLTIYYVTIVNMTSDREALTMKDVYTKSADSEIEQYIKKVKAEYKEESEKTLKMKELHKDASIEIISMNSFNGKRTAYFRRHVKFELT
jgi:hypothetical protein